MYNYDLEITYINAPENLQNKKYQSDLINVFSTDHANIFKINEIQCRLYQKYKKNESLLNLLNYFKNNQTIIPLELSLETCFILLFSYDYFYIIHKCLQDINKYDKITEENYEKIYFLIKKK